MAGSHTCTCFPVHATTVHDCLLCLSRRPAGLMEIRPAGLACPARAANAIPPPGCPAACLLTSAAAAAIGQHTGLPQR